MAGIAASRAYGVAKNATLHSARALGCDNTGSWSYFVAGLDWIIAHHVKPAIINASLGGPANSVANEAIRRAVAAGLTYVGSAGNESTDACGFTPGTVAEAITVGNVDSSDDKSRRLELRSVRRYLCARGRHQLNVAVRYRYAGVVGHLNGGAARHRDGRRCHLQRHPQASPAEVRRELLRGATRDKVVGEALPNYLLFSRYMGDIVAPSITWADAGCRRDGWAVP